MIKEFFVGVAFLLLLLVVWFAVSLIAIYGVTLLLMPFAVLALIGALVLYISKPKHND